MRTRRLLLPALLFLVTLATFWPGPRVEFLNYDDAIYVLDNRPVLAGLTPKSIQWALTATYAQNWHPLTWLSLMLDAQVYGPSPWGFHLTNALLHAANAALLYLLLSRITGSAWRSALVAALFALHPLRAESVAWVAERKDVLSTFFGLLALLAYAAFARRDPTPPSPRRQPPTSHLPPPTSYIPPTPGRPTFPSRRDYLLLAILCYALSLLAKPMLVTLPLLLLILDFWPLRRLSLAATPIRSSNQTSQISNQKSLWQLLTEKLPFFLLSALSAAITFDVSYHSPAMRSLAVLGPLPRLNNVLVSSVRYLGKIFWPTRLSMFYPLPTTWPVWPALAAGAALLLITAAVLAQRSARPWLAAGWAWYVIALLPVIGIVHVGDQAMANRYTYIPGIGIALLVVWSIPETWLARRAGRVAVGAGAAVLLVALAYLTRIHVDRWGDPEKLARYSIEVSANNWMAEKNLATFLEEAHRPDEALLHYQRVQQLRPQMASAYYDLGAFYQNQGQYDVAERFYRLAVQKDGTIAQFRVSLANALALEGRDDAARAAYLDALVVNPASAEAHNNLGVLLGKRGDRDGEQREYLAAIAADPDYAMAHRNLGDAFLRRRDYNSAIAEYQAAHRLKPGDDHAKAGLVRARRLLEEGTLDPRD